MSGITVGILGQPGFGTTTTRSDGWYDIAVNGGTSYVVQFSQTVPTSPSAPYYLQAQRHADARWHDYTVLPDVYLVLAKSPNPFTLGTSGSSSWYSFAGPTTTTAMDPGSAPRTPLVVIPPSTTVTAAYDTSGAPVSWTPPSTANLRFTEFSIGGSNGNKAMPGDLPPSSAYTYAFEATIHEAALASVDRVVFNAPLAVYVDNFTGQSVGDFVPSGSYDSVRGVWQPETKGVVVKMITCPGGGSIPASRSMAPRR